MRTLHCLLVLVMMAPTALGQHAGHEPDQLTKFDRSPAQYAMTVMVDAAGGKLSIWADLSYTNSSTHDLQSILFQIPDADHFKLDSILLFGTPLDTSRVKLDQHVLTLAVPVKAGEMVPLQLSFTTRLAGLQDLTRKGEAVMVDDWYPRVTTPPTCESCIPEVADFRVELVIDTPLQVAAPGTWVNEIEHIGSLSERADSIFLSLLGRPTELTRRNRFHYRLTGAERMSFSVLRNPSMARIQFDQQRFDLYGTESKVSAGKAEFLFEASKIAREVVRRMGALPDGRFAFLFGQENRPLNIADRFGYVNLTSRDPERMLTELTYELVLQYFNRAGESHKGVPWSEGAAVYLAAVILRDLYPDRGYSMVYEWLEDQLPPKDVHRPLGASPFAFMETIRRPNRPLSPEDSVRFVQFFIAPSALQLLAAGTSDDAVASLLRRYSLEVRHRHAKADELSALITSELGEQWSSRLTEFCLHRQTYDWSIRKATFDKTDSGFVVSVEIDAATLSDMPIEVLLLDSRDTVYALYTPVDVDGRQIQFMQELPFRPTTILLDPFHKLPDNNRQDNVYISGRTGGRYRSTRAEFPTYKRLTRGD